MMSKVHGVLLTVKFSSCTLIPFTNLVFVQSFASESLSFVTVDWKLLFVLSTNRRNTLLLNGFLQNQR